MKLALPCVAILVAVLSGCASTATRKSSSAAAHSTPSAATHSTPSAAAHSQLTGKPGQHVTVRTTAYTHSEAGGHKNGIDGRLRFGGKVYSAAADWSWLPLGTRFRMCCNDRTYVIEDYGSALVGRQTIDLYLPTRPAMRQWGTRNVEIEILEWGSVEALDQHGAARHAFALKGRDHP